MTKKQLVEQLHSAYTTSTIYMLVDGCRTSIKCVVFDRDSNSVLLSPSIAAAVALEANND